MFTPFVSCAKKLLQTTLFIPPAFELYISSTISFNNMAKMRLEHYAFALQFGNYL
jgi:hypothetical protein